MDFVKKHRVKPGDSVDLSSIDAKTKGPTPKREGVLKLGRLNPIQQQRSRLTSPVAALVAVLIGIAVIRRRRINMTIEV